MFGNLQRRLINASESTPREQAAILFGTTAATLGTMAGENAVVAQPAPASSIALDTSGSPAKYVFPTDLEIDPNLDHDEKIVFTVNTYQDFRWQDASSAGYQSGVFDVSSAGFETVTQLGANSIATSIE